MVKEHYQVSGMTCASCAVSLESYLKVVPGVNEVNVNYPNHSVSLNYDHDLVSLDVLRQKAGEIGYEIVVPDGRDAKEVQAEMESERLTKLRSKLLVSAIFSIPVFVISMFMMGVIPGEHWILMALSLPVLIYGGSEFFVNAWKRIKHFSANMDTLVALSTGVAFLYSCFNTVFDNYLVKHGLQSHVYFESAVVIITLILLGRYLEERAKGRASSAIKQLMELTPGEVRVVRNGEEITIPIGEVMKGDLILVRPGDKIPVDGRVKKGESYVDESTISGEPIPVKKAKRDTVYAGTINQQGSLRILADKVGSDTVISQIVELVKQAQASKPAIQKLADKIAGVFVPVVIGLALITFAIWYFIGPEPPLTQALVAMITVLIIACPCALGLATPTALMVGIGKGAQTGLLFRDAQALESLHKVNAVILDKTGTITEGKPSVTDVVWENESDRETGEQILLAMEAESEHPIAESIANYLKNKNVQPSGITGFQNIPGNGVKAELEGVTYYVGGDQLVASLKIELAESIRTKWHKLRSEAKTVVTLIRDGKPIGLIAVSDKVKSDSSSAVSHLQHMGIEVHMVTGDNEETANAIAAQVGLKHVHAGVLPEEKGTFVKDLQSQGKTVAMVGDGVNDSYALAQADIGVAMGSGTDIAMEAAGVTIMNSDLSQLVRSINLSTHTMKTIRQNLFWAFIYNIVAIPVAAGVLYPAFGFTLNPMIAGAAMSMSSISVLLNSLRLKRKKI